MCIVVLRDEKGNILALLLVGNVIVGNGIVGGAVPVPVGILNVPFVIGKGGAVPLLVVAVLVVLVVILVTIVPFVGLIVNPVGPVGTETDVLKELVGTLVVVLGKPVNELVLALVVANDVTMEVLLSFEMTTSLLLEELEVIVSVWLVTMTMYCVS